MNQNPGIPELVGIGAVFIDDIVLPTGQTYMAQLGGGVVHALMGAVVWDERPGIVALCGQGLPDEARVRLERHLDTRGLHELNIPQMRAWQLFEEDGSRRELYRVREIVPFTTGAQPEHLHDEYRESRAFYLLQGFDGIHAWCDELNGMVLWEPLQQVMLHENRALMRETLQACEIDIVSPNLIEAQAIYGDQSHEDLLAAFFDDGARIVALRMGAEGSLIAHRDTGERHFVGAVPRVNVIDQTGAGNTYCGALLAGIVQGKTLREAACMASVSASFCIEQRGALNPDDVDKVERDSRYTQLLP